MDAWKVFGLKNAADAADPALIRDLWLREVSWWKPGMEFTLGYREANAAAGVLLGLDIKPESDWLPVLVSLVNAMPIRETPDVEAEQIEACAGMFKKAPKTVTHDRLADVPECQQASDLVAQLLGWEEFAVNRGLILGPGDFNILWKPRSMTGKGTTVHASMSKIPEERRALWPTNPAPGFCLRINLPYWLLCDDVERKRLIHHELCHASRAEGKAQILPHAIEENLETVMRFGARDASHARLMAIGMGHTRTQKILRTDPDGQELLPLGGGFKPVQQVLSGEGGRTL